MFVAAALAATASGCEDKPKVCLSAVADEYRDASAVPPVDAGPTTSEAGSEPQPCLSVPMPCLTVAPPSDAGPPPRVCLKVAPPRDAGKPGPCLTY